jgi:hypothetical protein
MDGWMHMRIYTREQLAIYMFAISLFFLGCLKTMQEVLQHYEKPLSK